MRRLFWLLGLLCASVALAQNQAKEPLAALPGDTVQVTTATELESRDHIVVTLTAAPEQCAVASGASAAPASSTPPPCPTIDPIGVDGPGQKSFSFSLPPNACVCLYKMTATATGPTPPPTEQNKNPTPPPSRNIDITSPQYIRVSEKPPTVTGVSPKAIYSDDAFWTPWSDDAAAATVVFLGPATLKGKGEYSVRFAARALPPCSPDINDPKKSAINCFRRDESKSQDGQVAFLVGGKHFLSDFKGKQAVSLVRNGVESAPQDLTVVNAASSTPLVFALGITLALALLIYGLLYAAGKTMQQRSGKGYLLTALFLDEETQTYSLSKCQFYAWTFASVLGYVFFAVARSVVQGSPEFPDIPGNLPGILLFSAGTSVLSTGITSTKGSKGAGEVHPTLADFITTGGVVAPERLQFVVWTVTGIFSFLTIVFQSDPLTVSTLPTIPAGFLQLMGISSAGYLGGKLARKAGPVIKGVMVDSITGAGDQTQLTLKLTGTNLDPNAQIKVDGEPIRDSLFQVSGTPDPQTKLCTDLTVVLKGAAAKVVNTHLLTVVNSDSQAADVTYPADPMIVDPVTVAHAITLQKVDLTGDHFAAGTTAQWKDAAGTVKDIPSGTGTPASEAVVFNNPKSLSVFLIPGSTTGDGQLTLFSPLKLGVTTKITVT
jgi:hypothetical protein